MHPFSRSNLKKCNYCGYVALSTHELLTSHTCSRTLGTRNLAQQSSNIYRPSVIKRAESPVSGFLQSIAARQNRTSFHPPQSVSSSLWDEILDESELPVPVLECINKNKLSSERNNNIYEIFDESKMRDSVIKKNEFSNKKNNSSRNNEQFISSQVIVNQSFPSTSSLNRASSSRPLDQSLKKSREATSAHTTESRLSPVDGDHISSSQLTSLFDDTEPLTTVIISDSELIPEPSSESMYVTLVSAQNKKIILDFLDNVMNEIEKRMEQLPIEIKLRLELELLQEVLDLVEEEKNTV